MAHSEVRKRKSRSLSSLCFMNGISSAGAAELPPSSSSSPDFPTRAPLTLLKQGPETAKVYRTLLSTGHPGLSGQQHCQRDNQPLTDTKLGEASSRMSCSTNNLQSTSFSIPSHFWFLIQNRWVATNAPVISIWSINM